MAADRTIRRIAAGAAITVVVASAVSHYRHQPPATAGGSPTAAKAYARQLIGTYGWDGRQWGCLDHLWTAESHWQAQEWNTTGSGAYGIPQALPASKMAAAGKDWRTNAATQVRWGLGYIKSTYGSPCAAWAHETADGWY